MKETGIVRKLDNLGRLVIPKEIRRCMRIKEGSPIEFGLLPSGEIVLSSYSLVNQISDFADDFCEIIGDMFDLIVYIGDRNKIISSHGVSKKQAIGAKFSDKLLTIIDSKDTYLASSDDDEIITIFDDDKVNYKCQLIFPIIIQGEREGVIILASDTCVQFNESHKTCLKLIAKFLSIQLE